MLNLKQERSLVPIMASALPVHLFGTAYHHISTEAFKYGTQYKFKITFLDKRSTTDS